jgi:SAM-dependent MidA family methyltransferase
MAKSMSMRAKSLALHRILDEIAANGPLTFARFMELALYDSLVGYYAAGGAEIGKRGDFFTNVSVGPVFGKILAGQFREMWLRLDRPPRFSLVEQGADDGQLALDILTTLDKQMLAGAEYWIVEPLASLRREQAGTLQAFKTIVHWVEDVADLPLFEGVHFSNELVDALPFHLVRSRGGGDWEELCVTARQDRLTFAVSEPQPLLSELLKTLPHRAKGTIVELRPAASAWMQSVGGRLRAGFILVIDYGFSRRELLSPRRTQGTFACYRLHRRDFHPLDEPGQKDITAHVDFTSLAEAALDVGLRLEGYTDQHHFLVGATQDLLKEFDPPLDAAAQKTLRSLRTLLHPESMGTQFRYLALSKGVESVSKLSGFQFSRDPRRDLFSAVGHPRRL